ncbi:unnamed protein product, partial [Rotaria sp. Silwood1]
MTGADDTGICGLLTMTCSQLELCESLKNNGSEPGYVCVHHPRCHDRPVWYPLSMIDQRICPPMT